MEEKIYDIWLQQALGYNNHRVKTIYEVYESIKEFYESGEYGWRLCGCLTNSQISCLQRTSLGVGYNILRKCLKLGYKILTLSDENYPPLLYQLSNPPNVIYIKGDISCLKSKLIISIVGTRDPTRYGLEMAEEIAYKVASGGGTIVSGGALGIDAAAHRGALNAGGNTIAVLGCGINYDYLSTNALLRSDISKSGALVSEYPPNYPVYSHNFPIRNRIISGLSLGTIVVEAGKNSGSLITANLANEQNRDVFVVPVDMRSPLSIGTVSLINDGAKVIVNIKDIIEEYRFRLENKSFKESKHFKLNYSLNYKQDSQVFKNKIQKPEKQLPDVSEDAKIIYNLLKNKQMHVDEICKVSGLVINKVLSALTELEIYGLIKNYKGREYERIDMNF